MGAVESCARRWGVEVVGPPLVVRHLIEHFYFTVLLIDICYGLLEIKEMVSKTVRVRVFFPVQTCPSRRSTPSAG